MLLPTLLTAAAIGFSAGVTPGPLQAFFLSAAIKGGWKRALPAAFAPLVTDGLVIPLVLLVLTSLPPAFLQALQIGSALFILYLAWGAFKAFRHYQSIEAASDEGGIKTLLKSAVLNILAPGPWLFWGLFNGPNLLEAWAVSPWWGAGYLVSFYGVFILTNIVLIALFSAARRMGEKVQRVLLLVSAVVLAGFAAYQFLQGVNII
jgi:threonine/homoserine/homoserine lactone efflux protein